MQQSQLTLYLPPMKKLLSFQSIIIISCFLLNGGCKKGNSTNDSMRAEVEAKIKPTMNDPDSYEFVGLALIDSTRYRENMNRLRDEHRDDLEYGSPSSSKADITRHKVYLAGIDSLNRVLGSRLDSVASYTYSFQFRAKNAFGAKVLTEHQLQTDQNRKIINIITKKGEHISGANGFPGKGQLDKRYFGL